MQRACVGILRGSAKFISGNGGQNAVKRIAGTRTLADVAAGEEKIVAAVIVERLPVVLPQISPPAEAFQSFSFEWRQQYRREYPQEFLDASSSRGDDEGEAEYEPAPTVTEADETNDRRSLQRALNRRLYLLIRGIPYGGSKDTPVWHFPEKEYAKEESLRKCAEAVMTPFVSNPEDLFFVGNAPSGHISYRLSDPNYKRFFFKSQLIAGKVQVKGKKIKDYAWVSKAELSEYLDPSETEYMKKLLMD